MRVVTAATRTLGETHTRERLSLEQLRRAVAQDARACTTMLKRSNANARRTQRHVTKPAYINYSMCTVLYTGLTRMCSGCNVWLATNQSKFNNTSIHYTVYIIAIIVVFCADFLFSSLWGTFSPLRFCLMTSGFQCDL